jgi:hypothetical protein
MHNLGSVLSSLVINPGENASRDTNSYSPENQPLASAVALESYSQQATEKWMHEVVRSNSISGGSAATSARFPPTIPPSMVNPEVLSSMPIIDQQLMMQRHSLTSISQLSESNMTPSEFGVSPSPAPNHYVSTPPVAGPAGGTAAAASVGETGLSILDVPESLFFHLVSLTLVHVHPLFPLFHLPTFLPAAAARQMHESLLLAMCAVGTLFSKRPELTQPPYQSPQAFGDLLVRRAEILANAARGTVNESIDVVQAFFYIALYEFGAGNTSALYVSSHRLLGRD